MIFKNIYRNFCSSWCRRLSVFLLLMVVVSGVSSMVYAGGHDLAVTDAEKLIKAYIVSHSPWKEDQIKVKNISVPNNIAVQIDMVDPAGSDFELNASPRATLIGRTAFTLDRRGDSSSSGVVWISADIEVWVDVVMTSRSLKDHQIISGSDVYTGRQNLADLPAGYLDKPDYAVGKMLKRFTGGNRPLTVDILEDPPLLKRGDKVFIVAESDTLKITAVGVASEDGYRNRPVKVINLQSKREVFGDVIDSGTIKVRW